MSDFGNKNSKVYPGMLRGYRWWGRSYPPWWAHDTGSGLWGTGIGKGFRWEIESLATCFLQAKPLWHVRIGEFETLITDDLLVEEIAIVGEYTHSITPPDPLCTCGFYGFYDPHLAREKGCVRGEVFGVIEAHGRIVPGTKGFRAEKAKIVAISLPSRGLPENFIEEYPGVEVYSSNDELVAAYPPQGAPGRLAKSAHVATLPPHSLNEE